LGDKTHSVIFDNSKIKRIAPGFACTIPFAQGVREVMAWYDADLARQMVDARMDQTHDAILADYPTAWSKTLVSATAR
jgi:hypothetical protein